MTLLEILNKLGIGNTEIKIDEQEQKQEKSEQNNSSPNEQNNSSPNEQNNSSSNEQNNSSSNEQQLINQLRNEIASLKQSNQDLLLHTQAHPEPTTNELILSIAKLGGIIDGE